MPDLRKTLCTVSLIHIDITCADKIFVATQRSSGCVSVSDCTSNLLLLSGVETEALADSAKYIAYYIIYIHHT